MSEQPQPSKPRREWPPLAMAGVLLVGYLGIVWFAMHGAIKADAPYLTELITTLRDAFMISIMYIFGTTASSARKTELLSKAEPVKE